MLIHDNADARAAILSVLARHQDAENQCRAVEIAASFAVQGLFEADGKVIRGRRSIQAAFERLRTRPGVAGSPSWPAGVIRQSRAANVEFVSATEARSHSLFVATSATGVDHTGSYSDRFGYEPATGQWLIVHRVVVVDTASATSAARSSVRARRRPALVGLAKRPSVAGPSVSRRVG